VAGKSKGITIVLVHSWADLRVCMEVSEAYHMGAGTQSMEHCINSTDGRIGSAVFTEYDFGLIRSDSHSAFGFRVVLEEHLPKEGWS
jgi:hypothetical protein